MKSSPANTVVDLFKGDKLALKGFQQYSAIPIPLSMKSVSQLRFYQLRTKNHCQ